MCHPIWLYSRKYGTVWYHPARSKLWYLTTLSSVNFQEKLTGTSRDSSRVWSQLVRLAVCLALGAHFASTPWSSSTLPSHCSAARPTPQMVTSPEPRQGRPWMHGAAEHRRRHFLRPFQPSECNPRWARTLPPPFPGQAWSSPRQIPAIFIPVRGLDHIARSEVFLGAGTQNPGTCS
jgi:hypothetical protein